MRALKIYRKAQAPPGMPPPGGALPPPPPPGGGLPGLPPLGGPPGMPPLGAPPGAPPGAPTGPKEQIGSPLDTVFKILYDADIMDKIQGAGKDTDELALEIWEMYGGTPTGGVDPEKMGHRSDKQNVNPETEQNEGEVNDKQRWRRLPVGENIGDITTLSELKESIEGISSGLKKPKAPAGPGGAPPMASVVNTIVRLASLYDTYGQNEKADALDRILRS